MNEVTAVWLGWDEGRLFVTYDATDIDTSGLDAAAVPTHLLAELEEAQARVIELERKVWGYAR